MGKILLFNKWELGEVKVEDAGLERHINLSPIIVPRTSGRFTQLPIRKKHMSIVERFMNKLMVPGHKGKKHKLTSGRCCGNVATIYKAVEEGFDIIHQKTKKNPVEVLVRAVENSAVLEEIAAYRLGGIIARRAVITSPQRRLDVALKHLAQGIYKSRFKSRKSFAEATAEELILAASNDKKSFAVSERMRIEKEAEGAR
jgi:small subunit ribosomal protein S7